MYDEITIGNPYFIQTIDLLKHLDKLKSFKNGVRKEFKNDKLPELRSSLKMKPFNRHKFTNESIDEVCKKTMILILTHAGFHKVDIDCFNLIYDLFKSYLKNLTSLFRKKLDQDEIVNKSSNLDGSSINQSSKSSDRELLLLGKVFNELGLSFSTFQQFNYGLVLYRDHVLNQIEDLKVELNLPSTNRENL